MADAKRWLYEPCVGVGPFRFGMPLKKHFSGYLLYFDSKYQNSDFYTEKWKVKGLDVSLNFDKNHLLYGISISDQESFVFLGEEIIGMKKNRLKDFFGRAKFEWFYGINDCIVQSEFSGDIITTVLEGRVWGIYVKANSMPYYNKKMFKKFA
jgi:hypothetical protein